MIARAIFLGVADGWIRPDLQAFFWLRAFSAPEANPNLPTNR